MPEPQLPPMGATEYGNGYPPASYNPYVTPYLEGNGVSYEGDGISNMASGSAMCSYSEASTNVQGHDKLQSTYSSAQYTSDLPSSKRHFGYSVQKSVKLDRLRG